MGIKIRDRVYGDINVTEPVLIELINSAPIQRLKGINQTGASRYILPNKDITRYEHCVGVMILLRILEASLEEQIAGLLHDVSHTAFSHVIDFVFDEDNKEHNFHERFFEKIIRNSEIPKILNRYGFDVDRILDEKNFSLLERSLPDLCADRIDYTLRDLVSSKCEKKDVEEFMSGLVVHNEEIMMKNAFTARSFAEQYMNADKLRWSSPIEIVAFKILADAIKTALKEGILIEDDIFEDDDYVYSKLRKADNLVIQERLKQLNPKLRIMENGKEYDFFAKTKLRFVDPKFILKDGIISKVSSRFPEFKKKILEHTKRAKDGSYQKIIFY